MVRCNPNKLLQKRNTRCGLIDRDIWLYKGNKNGWKIVEKESEAGDDGDQITHE